MAQTVTITLIDRNGNPQTNLTGIRWAWYDTDFWAANATPVDVGTAETTDGTGEIVIESSASSLTTGGSPWIMLYDPTGEKIGLYRPTVD